MTDCGCRKGRVSPGCPRHSVLELNTHRRRGPFHRLLIEFEQRWYAKASPATQIRYWQERERRRNGEATKATKEKG